MTGANDQKFDQDNRPCPLCGRATAYRLDLRGRDAHRLHTYRCNACEAVNITEPALRELGRQTEQEGREVDLSRAKGLLKQKGYIDIDDVPGAHAGISRGLRSLESLATPTQHGGRLGGFGVSRVREGSLPPGPSAPPRAEAPYPLGDGSLVAGASQVDGSNL